MSDLYPYTKRRLLVRSGISFCLWVQSGFFLFFARDIASKEPHAFYVDGICRAYDGIYYGNVSSS